MATVVIQVRNGVPVIERLCRRNESRWLGNLAQASGVSQSVLVVGQNDGVTVLCLVLEQQLST